MLEWVEAQIEDGPNLRLIASELGIRAIEFVREGDEARAVPVGAQRARRAVPVLVEGIRQLQAYFRGGLREFDLPLEILGTPFSSGGVAAIADDPVWRDAELPANC